MRQKFVLIGLFLVLITACTEKNEITPFEYPKIFTGETSKSWKIRNVQLVRSGKGTLTFTLNNCILDDIYTFSYDSERSYKVTDGASKCSPDDPDVLVESSWSFANATSTLTIEMPLFGDGPIPFTLKEVDAGRMVIDIYANESSTAAYRVNFTPTSEK